jgi:hypothetical protein
MGRLDKRAAQKDALHNKDILVRNGPDSRIPL